MKKYLKYHEGIQIHVVTQIQRFSQIVEILGKYGFGIVLEKVFPDHSRGGYPINGGSPEPPAMYERMRLAIEELGPAFVKFGQILSTRADLLPPGDDRGAQKTAGPREARAIFGGPPRDRRVLPAS